MNSSDSNVLVVTILGIVVVAIIALTLPMLATSGNGLAFVTALTAVILAAASFYQALKTGTMVEVMKKSNQLEYDPQLLAYLELGVSRRDPLTSPVIIMLRVANIGRAPAVDINLVIKFTHSQGQQLNDYDRSITKGVIMKFGHSDYLLCPPAKTMPTDSYLPPELGKINISGTYKDVGGNDFQFAKTIDVKEFFDMVQKAQLTRNVISVL